MTLIGIISDAHGNPFGMRKCLEQLRKDNVSQIYFLGDAVGYLPLIDEVIEIIKDEDIIPLMGNHDAMLCNVLPLDNQKDNIYRLTDISNQIRTYVCETMATWPRRIELNVYNRRVLLVHGSPWEELTEYIYESHNFDLFEKLDYDAVFFGHTHRPFIKVLGNKLVVNSGSCGLPRDYGNLASCVIYNPVDNSAMLRRVSFNIENVISASAAISDVHPDVYECLRRVGANDKK